MYNSSDFKKVFTHHKAKAIPHEDTSERKENAESCPVRMMIDIHMTNGIRMQQRNLTYQNLKRLIEKLEGQC